MSDIHTETAKKMFHTDNPTPEQRNIAKTRTFYRLYGGGRASMKSYWSELINRRNTVEGEFDVISD